MLPAGGDFQRPAGVGLAFDVGEIRVGRRWGQRLAGIGIEEGVGAQVGDHGGEAACRQDGDTADQRSFGGIGGGQDQDAAAAGRLPGQRQGATHGAQFAGKGQLAGKFVAVQPVGGNLPGGGEDAEGNRQVEAAAFLGQVGRGEVDGDTPLGEVELPGLQRGPDPVAGLAHFDVREPDKGEGGQSVGKMDLYSDFRGQEADEGATGQNGQAHDVLGMKMPSVSFNAFGRTPPQRPTGSVSCGPGPVLPVSSRRDSSTSSEKVALVSWSVSST